MGSARRGSNPLAVENDVELFRKSWLNTLQRLIANIALTSKEIKADLEDVWLRVLFLSLARYFSARVPL